MTRRITIRQLLTLHANTFKVAYYQRHYVWGQYRAGEKDSVTCLTESLLQAYKNSDGYFLQGIMMSDNYVVDGQQRITYLKLLLTYLGYKGRFAVEYDNRREAEEWLNQPIYNNYEENSEEPTQDIYFFKLSLRLIDRILTGSGIRHDEFCEYILDHVSVLHIPLNKDTNAVEIYKMMNGTKARMDVSDIIKADIMRKASDATQPKSSDWELTELRSRYAREWDTWVRWWNRADVHQYYSRLEESGLDLLLKLCLRHKDDDFNRPLAFSEFTRYIKSKDTEEYHSSKHFFKRLRRAQLKFEGAYSDSTTYNRLRAILLLQPRKDLHRFLYLYIIEGSIDEAELERYYKLSFIGMSIDSIYRHESPSEYFDAMLASLSMPDVYHSDTKRDVFNLLLRLNIDEDIKLGRRFDFSVWDNRSLEHIYSKSKVWHSDNSGKIYDGNDNVLSTTRYQIEQDKTFMHRNMIVNHDGTQLSEHCLGNLVLLYGANNATFGNATFEQKKMMFLTPGDRTVFQSRNLLHTVCVFAGNQWDHKSIVDNYNMTLKNLKIYYGFK